MSELYNKLQQFRDEKQNDEGYDYVKARDVVNQMQIIAFNNKDNPDTLPNVFFISDVHYHYTDELESIMKDIGYEVEATVVTRNIVKGVVSFKVTVK